MASKAKDLSEFVRDVKIGDKVMFELAPKISTFNGPYHFTGYCLKTPEPFYSKNTSYCFSETLDGRPIFSVRPRANPPNLRPHEEAAMEVRKYWIIARQSTMQKLAGIIFQYRSVLLS